MSKLFRNIVKTVYNASRNLQSSTYKSSFAEKVEYGYRNRGYLGYNFEHICDPKFSGYIPTEQLTIVYTNCMGPGANEVTIVDTKVEIGFQVYSAAWIRGITRRRLAEKYKNELTNEGFLFFVSNATKCQYLNHAHCLEQIRMCITEIEQDEMAIPGSVSRKDSVAN